MILKEKAKVIKYCQGILKYFFKQIFALLLSQSTEIVLNSHITFFYSKMTHQY